MALGSQQSNVDALSDLGSIAHSIFTGDVKPGVRWESYTAQMYTSAQEGDYRYDGLNLNGATDLLRPHGAQGSNGFLPDSSHQVAANWQTTPVRRYVRRAIDHFVEAAVVKGPGAYADYATRLYDQMWGAWRLMEIRHAVAGSDGILCLCSSRTSATEWVAKDGYNHTDTNPLMLLEKGMVIGHHSTDGGVIEGAGAISSIAHSTKTITMVADWEQVAVLAAGDIVCAATTTATTTDYFKSENNLAQNGQADVIDPDGNLTTVFNIAEGTFERWKPPRKVSATFGHLEITEYMAFLEAKSTYPVTPDSHTAVVNGVVYAQLAHSLEGFQMQMNLGKTLEGGYNAVRVAGHDLVKDPFQLHDVMSVYCTEDLYHVDLVAAGYYDGDGSERSRIADFDGSEWFARDYGNCFSPARNRCGALTTIATPDVNDDDYTPVPDY